MSRFQKGVNNLTPALSSIAQDSVDTTVVDLFNPEHPVNNKSLSGKRSGMAIIIDGHTWVAEGSSTTAPWYRKQKHVEQQMALLRGVGNLTSTAVTANAALVPAILDVLEPVEPFFFGDWIIDASTSKITYTGEETIFEFNVNGDLRTSDSSGTGGTMSIELFDSRAGEGLTGATKVLNVAKVQGGNVSIADFTLHGYARVFNGDFFQIKAGANFNGNLLANNILLSAEPMDTLLYYS